MNESTLSETTDPDFEFRYIEIGGVSSGDLVETPKTIRFGAAPSRARRIVKYGDTIVSTVRTYLKAVWYTDDLEDNLICSTGFAVLTPKEGTVPKFASYVAQSLPFTDQVTSESVGVAYPAIAEKRLGDLRFWLPPPEEQASIVQFLDHADEQIRRYIAAKKRLIALLEEQRQVVIHQAVTRGLEPNVRFEESGVEWLGDVPHHWQRQRLKTVLKPIDERSTTGSETLLSLRRDYGVVVYDEHFERPSQSESLVGFKLVSSGQLVVNRLQANNGLVFNSNLNGLVSPDYSVFQEKLPLHMRFLSDLLRTSAYRAYFRRNATGLGTGTSGFLRLYDDVFLATPVCLPPLGEQCAIAKHLDQVGTDIDSTVARTRRQIDLMNEYRTRLIADVVTGQLDVRAASANLLDPLN